MEPKAKESVYMDISMHNRRIRPIKHQRSHPEKLRKKSAKNQSLPLLRSMQGLKKKERS
jgi:hypothetical protein